MKVQQRAEAFDRGTICLIRVVLAAVGFAAFIWLMKTGTPVFMPLVFALVVGVVFAPLADLFGNLGAPSGVGALAVLLIVLSAIGAGGYIFYPVIAEFVLRVPVMWNEVQGSLSGLKSTMENMEEMQSQVAQSLSPTSSAGQTFESATQVAVPTFADVVSLIPAFAAQIMVFVGILYFFLLTRVELYRYADHTSAKISEDILCRAEAEVSRYFLTITAINASFGALVALMLSFCGMQNAVYWGSEHS